MELRLKVNRRWTERPDDIEAQRLLQGERARLVHALVGVLDLDVTDWGNTDDIEPHEIVEIITVLGSAGAFTALVQIARLWVERNTMKDVIIEIPTARGPLSLKCKSAPAAEIDAFVRKALEQ